MSIEAQYVVNDRTTADKWAIKVTGGVLYIDTTSDDASDEPIVKDTINKANHFKIFVDDGVLGCEDTTHKQNDYIAIKDQNTQDLWQLRVSAGIVNITGTAAMVHNYAVEWRDKNGNFKKNLTPWVTKLNWEWRRIGGCGDCTVKLAVQYRELDFEAGDDIQIKIKDGSVTKLVYRGWVGEIKPVLKKGEDITLRVRGYFDYLNYIVVHTNGLSKTYLDQEVTEIVENIIDNFIVPNTSITKGAINKSDFSPDILEFKTRIPEVLKTLGELIGNVEYGVDENLQFFWYNETDTVRYKFFTKNNIEVLQRGIDWTKLLNKIYLEGGELDSGIVFQSKLEADDSQDMYFLSEKILVNSAITTPSVADQYCGAILKQNARPVYKVKARIPNTDIRIEDLLPIGRVAFSDASFDQTLFRWGKAASGGDNKIWGTLKNDGDGIVWGGTYKSQVEKIGYTINNTEGRFDIQITLGGGFLETAAKIQQLDLMLSGLRQR